jgi:glycosyltransferase involved in cell wall biosynthesis
MKILHVITSLYTGGAERLMVDLLPTLRNDEDFQVDLLLINGVETPFKKALKQAGIKVCALSMTNDVYNLRNIFRFRRFLAHNDYDIIHTHNTACQLFVPIAKSLTRNKAKLVTTEHNTTNHRRTKWWLKPLDKWMYRKYAAIVCISDLTRHNLEQYLGTDWPMHTIYNGVDTKRFARPIKDISGKQDFVVTMVAAFRPQKDQDTLIRAFTHLEPNFRLQLVGGGQRGEELKALCSELGLKDRVQFLGVRMDVPDIMEQSDVIVLSSHWEGFGLAAVEGMASGRPMVATDGDGLRDIVGGAGVLFQPGDDQELASAIKRLCETPDYYRQVALACQERAQHYDISVMADGYSNLYRSL